MISHLRNSKSTWNPIAWRHSRSECPSLHTGQQNFVCPVFPNGLSRRYSGVLRITYGAHCSGRAFSRQDPFMGQSVSQRRSVTPCGTGPAFITHLHSFQCRATFTGGHRLDWYSETAFFDLSDAPITTISSTHGIDEWNVRCLGKKFDRFDDDY